MAVDISPALVKAIQKAFTTRIGKSKEVYSLYKKVNNGTATYVEARRFAEATGDILAKSYSDVLKSEVLPDGMLYYNIAEAVIRPTLSNNYDLVSEVCVKVQNSLNAKAGIGLKGVRPLLNEDRIDGIIDRVSSEPFENIKWILNEPVKIFSQSVVDDAVKTNCDFQYKSGLNPKVIRTSEARCCEWCSNLDGTYYYPNVPSEVFQRHDNCRCDVEYNGDSLKAYTSGSGRSNTFRA